MGARLYNPVSGSFLSIDKVLITFRETLRVSTKRQLRDLRGHLDKTLEALSAIEIVDTRGQPLCR